MTKLRHNEYPNELTEYRQTCGVEDRALLEILAPEKGTYKDLAIKAWGALRRNWHSNPYNIKYHSEHGFRFWWIEQELESVKEARVLPHYMKLKESEKKQFIRMLAENTNALVKTLRDLGLDGSLLYCESQIRGNWHIYEDQSDKVKEWFDKDGSEKIPLSRIIEFVGERAKNKISKSTYLAKQGKNAEAVAFIRLLTKARQEHPCYRKPLYGVSATFTNLLYGTDYDESSARKIVLG
jgi:hypothetical protein